MHSLYLLKLACALWLYTNCSSANCKLTQDWSFPDGFLVGTGTSSYQVEGAWNVSDKGESNWDRYTHTQSTRIVDQSNGDIASDSYHKYKEDVQLMKKLGLDFYRFSLSWPRILPTGYANVVSKDGIQYYNNLINELLKYNITPFVTIFHWDHPQKLQEIGGWANSVMVDFFGDYARIVYREFGDRVKLFTTFNEPKSFCTGEFSSGTHPPGVKIGKQAEYLCTHNILKAHARAYHIYDDEFRAKQNGRVGIVLNSEFYYPKYENDMVSNEVAFQFNFGRYAHPIFSENGDYPDIVKERIAINSKFEGLPRSRLPSFSDYWKNYIKGSFDFMGFNHYTSNLVEPAPKSNYTVYPDDHGLIYSFNNSWPTSASDWLRVVPQGFLDMLRKIKEEYGNPLIFITENGISDTGIIEDNQRIDYLNSYMKAMLTAIKTHGCNVKAYTIWSLLDNFEWERGYTEKFGLYHVNFNHPNRTRTPKKSVSWLKKVIEARKLP